MADTKFATVTLDTPIERGDQKIETVNIRQPTAGDFRGTSMTAVFQMEPVAVATVLARVSDPVVHKDDFLKMNASDAAALGGEVVNFLLTKSDRAAAGLTS